MNKDLLSLFLLFASICQLYVFRIFRGFVFYFKIESKMQIAMYGTTVSKVIMIIGICVSVYWRIQISNDRHSQEIAYLTRQDSVDDSLDRAKKSLF